MSATWCGVAWAGVVVAGALIRPSTPPRVRALVQATPRRPRQGPGVLGWRSRGVSVALVAVFGLFVWPPLAAALPGAALLVPRVRHLRAQRRRREAVVDGLPDVVDLVVLAAGAGLTVALTVAALARRAPAPFAAAFGRVLERSGHGQRLADALGELPIDLGEPIRPLTAALVATERYGVPLAPALDHLAHDARRERRRRGEVAARRLPVRLCFPLVCCTLPAFGLLTIVPLLAGALRSLHL